MAQELGARKVTRRFQVTIPEEVRKFVKVKEGNYVVFTLDKKTGMVFIQAAELVLKDNRKLQGADL